VDRTFLIPSVFVILFFFCPLHKFSIFHDTLFLFHEGTKSSRS
jgi:hypothetical protein